MNNFRAWKPWINRILTAVILFFIAFILVDLLRVALYPVSSTLELSLPIRESPRFIKSNIEKEVLDHIKKGNDKLLNREFNVTISGSQITTNFSADLSVDNAIASDISSSQLEKELLSFVNIIFGKIEIQQDGKMNPLFAKEDFASPVWSIASSTKILHLELSARKNLADDSLFITVIPAANLPIEKKDYFSMHFDCYKIVYANPTLTKINVTENQLSIVRTGGDVLEEFSFWLKSTATEGENSQCNNTNVSRRVFLQKLGDWLSFRSFSLLFFALFESLPLLIFLYLVRDYKNPDEHPIVTTLASCITGLLIFHFTLYFLGASSESFLNGALIQQGSAKVEEFLSLFTLPRPVYIFGLGPSYFGLPILSIVLPALLFDWWKTPENSGEEKIRKPNALVLILLTILYLTLFVQLINSYFLEKLFTGISPEASFWLYVIMIAGAMLVLALYGILSNRRSATKSRTVDDIVAFFTQLLWLPISVAAFTLLVIYYIEHQGNKLITMDAVLSNAVEDLPLRMWIIFVASLISTILYIIFRFLQKLIAPKAQGYFIATSATWLLILFAWLNGYELNDSTPDLFQQFDRLLLLIGLGTILISSFVFLVIAGINRIQPGIPVLGFIRKWAWVFIILAAIPMLQFSASSAIDGLFLTNLFTLAYLLDNLILFIWIGGVLWILYLHGKDNCYIVRPYYEIGLLMAAAMLFSLTARWLWIPITLLLGWAALHYLIIPMWDSEQNKEMFRYIFEKRNILLEKIININAAETAFWDFRKNIAESLSKGEINNNEFDTKLTDRRKNLDALIERSRVYDKSPKELALTFGPYTSAWRNAIHGATWGIVFALPWLILYFREFLMESGYAGVYPLWDYLADLLYITFRWAGMGFVFGYFFPHIRGNTGVSKGFYLFLFTFLPVIPISLIYLDSSVGWLGLLFWALQIFLQYMLLGLVAFDYWILRQGGRGWQMLFEVHGLPSLGISISGILAAVGTLVTTLLTKPELIEMFLDLFAPNVPTETVQSFLKLLP